MMDWTDRHCRYFHRLITRHTRLYTEMVTTGALLHGDLPRHLDFDAAEQPLALQVGGSEPADLAQAARLARQWGYAEININCGCPSERVQRGAFGACLMAEPHTVRDGVAAMRDVLGSDLPVTVKHRIGIDKDESYGFVRDFVGTVADAGCSVFIAHARNAWLKGLSPKENREIPPLDYPRVYQVKQDYPELTIALNGGVNSLEQTLEHLQQVDGVMMGREAYQNPYLLAEVDNRVFGLGGEVPSRHEVVRMMLPYMEQELAKAKTAAQQIEVVRHFLALQPGALALKVRLLRLLDQPDDLPVLAPLLMRETFFRVLTGPLGERLRELVDANGHARRIARAIDLIKNRVFEPLHVPELADQLHMSASSLHHRFKQLTAMSPLQFQKQLRLHEARRLMLSKGLAAAQAGKDNCRSPCGVWICARRYGAAPELPAASERTATTPSSSSEASRRSTRAGAG